MYVCVNMHVYVIKIHGLPFNSTSYMHPRLEIWLKPVTEQIYFVFALIFSSSVILYTPCILLMVRVAK